LERRWVFVGCEKRDEVVAKQLEEGLGWLLLEKGGGKGRWQYDVLGVFLSAKWSGEGDPLVDNAMASKERAKKCSQGGQGSVVKAKAAVSYRAGRKGPCMVRKVGLAGEVLDGIDEGRIGSDWCELTVGVVLYEADVGVLPEFGAALDAHLE